MRIIKVDATKSTNSLAREWFQANKSTPAVCFVARDQTLGRGQRGATWVSNAGENLTFSILFPNPGIPINNQFTISAAAGIAVLEVLKLLNINKLKLKWPNDIMAASYKIGGILIENSLSNGRIDSLVIGIGLNVNQTEFIDLPKAGSLKKLTGITYDLDELLQAIIENLERIILQLKSSSVSLKILQEYENVLFRKDVASTFQLNDGKLITGVIKGISSTGLLKVQVEDTIKTFDLKELKLLF